MNIKGANSVGRFNVEFEVANYGDIFNARNGSLKPEHIRRKTISGVVDSGAAMLVLPASLVKELGLPLMDSVKVRYADGRTAQRREAEGAYIELLGRHSIFNAVVEPKRTTALVGAIVLEALDLLVDCQHQRIVPRDPSGAVYEIE